MNGGRQNRQRRAVLLLVATVALVSGVFVACEPFCCVFEGETEVHAAMPCCTAGAAVSRPDVMRVQAVAPADRVPVAQSVVLPPVSEPPVTARPASVPIAEHPFERHRYSPPLFLAHAQLLI